MLGKRKNTMRRTSSVSLIGSGSVNGDSSPLPEYPKEKLKSSNHKSPGRSPGACGSAPWTVIGFHPKLSIDEEADLSAPISPHRASPRSSSKSPGGSPRSGLGDLLSGSRPWERKDEGVGLGIVVALSGSQEEICKEREDGRGFSIPGAAENGYGVRKASPQAHPHSGFAPSRASPPIPIHAPSHSNSGRHSPSHCTDRNCCPAVAFGLTPPSFKQELICNNSYQAGGGSSRPNSWSRPNVQTGRPAVNWGQQADMDVDRNEFYTISTPAHLVHPRQSLPSSTGFGQNFLDACHLCRRRLGEGRDIYIYRGDKAFCSPECRHQQILNDERPEKCAAAVMKVGGASDVRSSAQRSRVMAAGTATAAAA